MFRIVAVPCLILVLGAGRASAQPATSAADGRPAIAFQDGDRVAFLGDSFFEREYRFGLIETALTAAHPDLALTFRNLAWSGDTVRGEARALFGGPADGYAELLKSVDLVKPTVIFVAYGANESFDGAGALDAFLADYRRLLDDLSARTPRIVLLTPLPADPSTSPLPRDALEARNRVLSAYSEAIAALARERKLAGIDLFAAMLASMSRSTPAPLFEQGMFLTEAGYAVAAAHIVARTAPSRAIDQQMLMGIAGSDSGSREPLADLRALIVRKNDLFFHRWRPANVTYLYLFRQREQGNNAVEIPQFDPFVDAEEQKIAAARRALSAAPSTPASGGARR